MSVWKVCLALGITLGGCIDPITLGRECRNRIGACAGFNEEPPDPPPEAMDASSDARVLDASDPSPADASPSDALVVDESDAGSDAGSPARAVDLANGALELTDGTYGALALQPFDPIPIGVNLTRPWIACGLGMSTRDRADSVRNSGAGDVRPTEGAGFIESETGIGVGGLRQELRTPLKAGERYAFRIDARAAVGSGVTLEVWGSNLACVLGTKLADLGALSESWTSSCVTFVAPSDATQLTLQAAARGTSAGAPRVFFDNLRSDPTCL